MRARDFTHGGVRFNVLYLRSRRRVQLWYSQGGYQWEFRHGKDVPEGMTAAEAIDLVHRYVTGAITAAYYNGALPGE